mgnify:CR=1 FL=1
MKNKEYKKFEKEKKIIPIMIRKYCHHHHKTRGKNLCPECKELTEYALFRLDRCPFKKNKHFCSTCKVHCYKPEMREKIKKVGYVFQNPDYQLFMPTVKKELEYSCYSKEYAEEIAKKLDVYHLYSRHPHSLSEGQKRRVSISAILDSKPEVLILDEPTVGQDYNNLRNLVSVLNEINEKENTTIITITHDKRCAKGLSDKVFLIEDGVITKTGKDEVINSFLK